MPKIIQFKSLGGPEVLEFKDITLSKELGLDEILYSVKAFALIGIALLTKILLTRYFLI